MYMFKVRNELLPEIFISKFKKNKDISGRIRDKTVCIMYQIIEQATWKVQ